ncbi:MAG TPA: hypothetical protein VE997_01745, partial [Candidatus Limnocylindria bacterium]|nr:hypothetical protein [Candidatus Limnocylindria bacterium]
GGDAAHPPPALLEHSARGAERFLAASRRVHPGATRSTKPNAQRSAPHPGMTLRGALRNNDVNRGHRWP